VDAYQTAAVASWPLRALIERGRDALARQEMDRGLPVVPDIRPPSSRSEALLLLFHAAFDLGPDVRDRLVALLRNVGSETDHWRVQRALRDATEPGERRRGLPGRRCDARARPSPADSSTLLLVAGPRVGPKEGARRLPGACRALAGFRRRSAKPLTSLVGPARFELIDAELAAGERVGPFRIVGVPGKSPGEVALEPRRRITRSRGALLAGARARPRGSAPHRAPARRRSRARAVAAGSTGAAPDRPSHDPAGARAVPAGGLTGGRLYLAAYAQGFGATGLTFFDDEVTEFFSPRAAGKSAMFLVALGHPDRVALGLGRPTVSPA